MIIILLLCAMTAANAERSGDERWDTQLRKFSRIYSAIKEVYPDEVNTETLVFEAINGLLRTLDPHSYFLDPTAARSMGEDQEGNYYGIGTRITKYEDRLTVIAPIRDTPAQQLGILSGDVIIAINGKETKDLTIDEAMALLRGAKDSYVDIEIVREGLDKPISFHIKRVEIPLESISGATTTPQNPEIGFISIRSFGNTTAREFSEKMRHLTLEKNIKAIIIDLRGNAGGSLYAAVDIADFFLPRGKTVVSIKGRSQQQNFIAVKDNQYEDMPVAVLINRGSASASEIVASALQDHKKAVIIGARSWGKGLVQTVQKLSMNCSVALTTAKYHTPANRTIQRDYSKLDDYLSVYANDNYDSDASLEGGVIPDIPVKSDYYPQLLVNLISRGLFFSFSRELTEIQKMTIPPDFTASDAIIEKFKQFLKKNTFKYNPDDFQTHLKTIRYEIERDVISTRFGQEKGVDVYLRSDPVTARAVERLTETLSAPPRDAQNGDFETTELMQ